MNCLCGCGREAKLKTGYVNGGHHWRAICASRPKWEVDDKTGCWNWLGFKDNEGYGKVQLKLNGHPTSTTAQRYVYEQFRGKVAADMHVDHLCRNRGCVNPWHMEVVTPTVNKQRAIGHLSWDEVRQIRHLFPSITQRKLAKRFGVALHTIELIIANRTWVDPLYQRPMTYQLRRANGKSTTGHQLR